MSDDETEQQEQPRASVKHGLETTSMRITPPKDIRDDVSMEADEPWSWFWDDDSSSLYVRRTTAGLSGIPAEANAVGSSYSRRNGGYIDIAIPKLACLRIGIERGEPFDFAVENHNTVVMKRVNAVDNDE